MKGIIYIIKNRIQIVKWLLITFVITIFLLLVRAEIRIYKQKVRLHQLTQALTTQDNNAKIVTKYIRDSIEHTVIKEVPVYTEVEKRVAIGTGYLDTVSKALKVATRRIDEVTKVNATLQAENLKLHQKLKTVTGTNTHTQDVVYRYQDKYLDIEFQTSDTTVNFRYDIGLQAVKYYKRKWLLGNKDYYIDLYSDDSRVTINSVKRYQVQGRKQKRLGVGVNAGYAFIPTIKALEPFIGIGINYNIIEF